MHSPTAGGSLSRRSTASKRTRWAQARTVLAPLAGSVNEVRTDESDQSFSVTIRKSMELADEMRSREQERIEDLNPGLDDIGCQLWIGIRVWGYGALPDATRRYQ